MRTFGTAKLVGNEWHVAAEPHVLLRLKRLFRRAGKQFKTIRLAATEETSRDLLWFSSRYPLDFEPRDAIEQRAAAFDARTERFDALLAGRIEPRRFELAIPPREYQRVAAELALQAGGLLIADDLGTGKSCIAIAALTAPETRPALIVTLTHLPLQWANELHRFAPGMRVHVVRKASPYALDGANVAPNEHGRVRYVRRRAERKKPGQLALLSPQDAAPAFPDVLIINYHKLAGWADALTGKVRAVVFDEVQELRRSDSTKYASARAIAQGCDYRWGLSATPIYNYGSEFFSIMDVLRPGALGTREEFTLEWTKGANRHDPEKAAIQDPRAFGTYVREAGLMIRRTRAEVGRELPELTRSVMHVDADEAALDAVEADVAELARIILAQGQKWSEKGQAARDMDNALRQATGIAKAPHVAEFVRLLVESGEKVVLYSWHREVYAILEAQFAKHGIKAVFYTGTESPTQKEASKEEFCNGDARVLVMSLRAGAGLDGLQGHCRTVVFGELDWSPGVHEQAVGRVHRDGQDEPCIAYFLISDSASDQVMLEVLGLKREQSEGLRDPHASIVETVKDDALRTLAESYLRQRGLPLPGEAA